jgi:epsilon-lactone hydrolase
VIANLPKWSHSARTPAAGRRLWSTWEAGKVDATIRTVERKNADGVDAGLKILDDGCHGWQLFAPMLEEGMASIEECAAFIKAHLA